MGQLAVRAFKILGCGRCPLGSGLTGKVGLVAKLVWRVKLVAELRPGVMTETEVARIERDDQAGLADLGLRLAETKRLTAALQAEIVPAQVAAVGEQRRCCSSCGRRLASKGHYPVTFRSLFGDVPVRVRRLLVCPCQGPFEVKSFGVLDLGHDAVAPELAYVTARYAALAPFGKVAVLLSELLPITGAQNAGTVRNRTLRVGDRVARRRGRTGRGHNTPNPVYYLSDTDIVRASKRQHPVQGSGSDGNLGRLGSVGARSKGIADDTFVSPDRRLDLGPQIVAAGFLPGHLAAIGDHPQMAVALCWSGFGRRTRHRTRPWRYDDGCIRMTLRNSLADLILIVAAVGSEGSNWIGDLVEQSVRHRGIVDILPGQRDGDDLAAGGIDADMQLPPGSATRRSVLFDQPFAGSAEPQAGAVHQQM